MTRRDRCVVFVMWRCCCTDLSLTMADVQAVCPVHGMEQLARPEWCQADADVPLGVQAGAPW